MKISHLASIADLSKDVLDEIFSVSKDVKTKPETYKTRLSGQTLAMVFQKPSTRTRVSFQVGMYQLGGTGLVLGQHELQLGRGETVPDTAQVLSRFVDGIMARVFSHDDILNLIQYGSVPIINGLSDLLHPCQGICDYFTMHERFGSLKGLPVTYLGDGNNVAHSLANGAAKLGVNLTIATPDTHQPNADLIAKAKQEAEANGGQINLISDPVEAVKGSKVVYTDTWASMGQEEEHEARAKLFAPFQVNADLFSKAENDAIFMHCLPAHRGEEVTDEIADHERSVIFDQAENRLHTQKASLILMMGN